MSGEAPDGLSGLPKAPEPSPTESASLAVKPPRPVLGIGWELKRSRLKTLLRWILMIPQLIITVALYVAAIIVLMIGWFCALVLGRLPAWAHSFLAKSFAYFTRVSAYGALLTDTYPPFLLTAPADYPIQVELTYGKLSRAAVLFRWFLLLPAGIVAATIGAGAGVIAFVSWIIGIFAGRTPAPLYAANATLFRYNFRLQAYMLLLTSRYPVGPLGDRTPDPSDQSTTAEEGAPASQPLFVLARSSKVIILVTALIGLSWNANQFSKAAPRISANVLTASYNSIVTDLTSFAESERSCDGANSVAGCLEPTARPLATKMHSFASLANSLFGYPAPRKAAADAADKVGDELEHLANAATNAEAQQSEQTLIGLVNAFDDAFVTYHDGVKGGITPF